MEKAAERARMLVEALPYIKRFYGKVMVIKYGGSTLVDTRGVEKSFALDVVLMKYVGMHPVIVHGGGPFITDALRKAGKAANFVQGLRVTDKESIEIVGKILARVNDDIVSLIREHGGKAVGLNRIVKVKKFPMIEHEGKETDIGFVGQVEGVDHELFDTVTAQETIPVINPLGVDSTGETFNVNADAAAARIAKELGADKFFILTDVPGIMRDWENKESLISTLTTEEAGNLMKENVIISGMIPKVKSCIEALQGGVNKVHIVDGRLSHSLLLEIFTDKGIGTQMVK